MSSCGDLFSCAIQIGPLVIDAALALIAAASAIAAVTPTPSDDQWAAKAYRVIDVLALNIGYAKDRPQTSGGRFVPD